MVVPLATGGSGTDDYRQAVVRREISPRGTDGFTSLPAVRQQWLDQLNRDPASFARLEVEIHDHFRRLADQMTASLLAEATISNDQAAPGKKGAPSGPIQRRPPQARRLRLRFLGGLTVWIATIYCGPRSHTGRGRGREGTGAYPELAALGIRKGATPALHSQVGRLTALLPSIELARDELRHRGPTLDEKTVHRMARQLGAEVLATRTRDLRRFRDGRLPAGQEVAGQHVGPRSMADGSASAPRSRPRNARG
jgi:hypothetical protein